jgi:hypothetical protein
MTLQWAGVCLALATFLSIWWGHVGVRILEAKSANIWPPTIALIVAGLALIVYSLFAPNLIVSGVSSMVGITLLWDAFEMYRQSKRIMHKHAPANPNNPRHAALLAQGLATTEDLLDREPTGKPIVLNDQAHSATSNTNVVGDYKKVGA